MPKEVECKMTLTPKVGKLSGFCYKVLFILRGTSPLCGRGDLSCRVNREP